MLRHVRRKLHHGILFVRRLISNSTSDICIAFSPSGLRQFDVVFMVNNIVVRLMRYLPNLG